MLQCGIRAQFSTLSLDGPINRVKNEIAESASKLFDKMSGRVRLQFVRQNYYSEIGGNFMGKLKESSPRK
jgi:hypothetical protein